MDKLANIITQTLVQADIEKLMPEINTGREWYIDPESYQFIDKVIEMWFRTQGYDYFDNPYPDVIEMISNSEKGELTFKYIKP